METCLKKRKVLSLNYDTYDPSHKHLRKRNESSKIYEYRIRGIIGLYVVLVKVDLVYQEKSKIKCPSLIQTILLPTKKIHAFVSNVLVWFSNIFLD